MKIVVAGGTGFLGAPLVDALGSDHHDVAVLTRSTRSAGTPQRRFVEWTPNGEPGP